MTTGATDNEPAVRLCETDRLSPLARDLLDRAATVDGAMGFGPPRERPDVGPPVRVVEVETCLHRHGVSHDGDYVLAGVLTVREGVEDVDAAVVDLVVAPERRSIGVATAIVEALTTGPRAGWWGHRGHRGHRGLRAVAHGSHPAAERLLRRGGFPGGKARHHLVLPEHEVSPEGSAGAEPPVNTVSTDAEGTTATLRGPGGSVRVQEVDDDDVARILAVDPKGAAPSLRDEATALVASAIAHLRRSRTVPIEAVVDADDELLVEVLRALHFEHDRTDIVIDLDSWFD